MKRVVIRIAAYFAGAALCWGCFGELGPTPKPETEVIGFEAGTSMLLDDATRVCDLKTSDSLVRDFSVFALLNNNGSNPIFDGTVVTYNGAGWSYPIAKHWEWSSITDRYDFAGVTPASAGASRLVDAPGRLTVTADYDVTSATDTFDLMVAMYSRSGDAANRNGIVPMSFKHMLSAVRVDILNVSGSGNFRVNSYCFKNVVNNATVKATLNAAGAENFTWIDAESTSLPVRTENPAAGPHNPVAPGDTLRGAGFNLLIPQRLDGGVNLPALEITYTPTATGVPVTTPPILLKDILNKIGNEPITRWEMGVQYIYEISIRLDGGVEVRVITTDWDDITYETPGIMIPA